MRLDRIKNYYTKANRVSKRIDTEKVDMIYTYEDEIACSSPRTILSVGLYLSGVGEILDFEFNYKQGSVYMAAGTLLLLEKIIGFRTYKVNIDRTIESVYSYFDIKKTSKEVEALTTILENLCPRLSTNY
jgi:hypothetical protein